MKAFGNLMASGDELLVTYIRRCGCALRTPISNRVENFLLNSRAGEELQQPRPPADRDSEKDLSESGCSRARNQVFVTYRVPK